MNGGVPHGRGHDLEKYNGVIKLVVGQISTQPSGTFGISFERKCASSGTDEARCHERKETNVGTQIAEDPAWAQLFSDVVLDRGPPDTEAHILARTRIDANRETGGRPIF
jgi:hypothetical protein